MRERYEGALQQNETVDIYQDDASTVKWSMDNELDIIIVAIYQRGLVLQYVDELLTVATDVEQARAELARFDRDTTSTLHGTPPSDEPMWIAMADVATNWTLNPECFSMMIAGQAADLQSRTIESPSDLITYCNQVASSVGLVCIDIFEAEPEVELAVAMVGFGGRQQ